MDVARSVGLSRRGALGPLDRGDRAYLHRYRRGAAIVGAAAIALSPDLGAGVPVAPAAAAPIGVEAAAAGDNRRGRAARGRRRTESAIDARRPPALFLRHCDGLPWRVGAHPPGREISHRLLCRAVIRRHDRRIVRRLNRALYVFMDRGIPDPAGTGGVVPPARRQRAFSPLEQLVLAVSRRARDSIDRAVLVGGQGHDMAWRTPGMGGWRRRRTLGIAGARIERQSLENLRNRRAGAGADPRLSGGHTAPRNFRTTTARRLPGGPSRSRIITRTVASVRRSRRYASARARRCGSR